MDESNLRVVVLGSSDALATAREDNTYLVLCTPDGPWLIDCGGSPTHKLAKIGVDPRDLSGVALTHGHPDHIYGLPTLVQFLRLTGRQRSLPIFANAHAQARTEAVLEAVDLKEADFLTFCTVPEERNVLTAKETYGVESMPVRHSVQTFGLRITDRKRGRSLVYSADTEPCDSLRQLAQGADILIHECTVDEPSEGHSTPDQVGELAATCEVGELVLIHYPAWVREQWDEVVTRVRKWYGGPLRRAREGDVYEL